MLTNFITHLRLFLAQLIAPKGYEVANFDYAQLTASNCYFSGMCRAYLDILSRMDGFYGTDWRDVIYRYVKNNAEYYDKLVNTPPDSEPEFE